MSPYEDNLTVVEVKFASHGGHPFEAGHESILKDLIPAHGGDSDEPSDNASQVLTPRVVHQEQEDVRSIGSPVSIRASKVTIASGAHEIHKLSPRRGSFQHQVLELGATSFIDKCVGIYGDLTLLS
eukprot:339041-Rhodomonas_salina.1